MHIRSSFQWVLPVAMLAYLVSSEGGAGAQPAQGTPTSPPASETGGTVGFQRKTSLTPQEQLAESAGHLSRMEQSGAVVRKMLEEARKQRDVVKTLCLNDKLSQIDVAIRSGRDRKAQLGAAVSRNDGEGSNHEFTILTVLRQRSEQLVAEANQCIGEDAAFVADTRTKVSVDPSIADVDPPYPVTDPTLVVSPPPCTSCTL